MMTIVNNTRGSTEPVWAEKSISELLSTHNEMVLTATDLGDEKSKPRKSFRDRKDAERACSALHVKILSLRARDGQYQAEPQTGSAQQEESGSSNEDQDSSTSTEESCMPNRRRNATKKTSARNPARGRRPTLPDNAVITVVAKENPKRGTAKIRFGKYKSGMTLKQYASAIRDTKGRLARADVNWDSKQGWIRVKVPA